MKYKSIPHNWVEEQDKRLQELLIKAREDDYSALCTIVAGQLSLLCKLQGVIGNNVKKIASQAFDAGRDHKELIDFGEPVVEFKNKKREFLKYI